MKIVMEPLRNSQETLSTQNLIILRNVQCRRKFLVSYIKIRVTIIVLFRPTTKVTHKTANFLSKI